MSVWTDPIPLRQSLSISEIKKVPGVYRLKSHRFGWYYVGESSNVHQRLSRHRLGTNIGGFGVKLAAQLFPGGFLHEFLLGHPFVPSNTRDPFIQSMRDAVEHCELEVSVAYTEDRTAALALESAEVIRLMERGEWVLNRSATAVQP